ncbi:zinc-binding dehydrogenase [Amycolatopsis acidiphila]|uniref:zinc-binding dehydrogenase n=1 Tax=Amycolatopsis acidiphila TaxID=715473 RepID=UPI001643B50E|nr:zinc-binding dehydrogenase [Amycolatopsis acidiphila]UIJ59527.1 zinc-binding dehydrogenase [Amycolatopsis acidiphila]
MAADVGAERVREAAPQVGHGVVPAFDRTARPVAPPACMRTLRFHEYEAPLDVLRLEDTEGAIHNDVLGEYAQLAAEGRFSVPVARTFPLEDWQTAAAPSQSGQARGKLVLRIG